MDWGCPQSQQTGTVPRVYLHLKPPSRALRETLYNEANTTEHFLCRAGSPFRPPKAFWLQYHLGSGLASAEHAELFTSYGYCPAKGPSGGAPEEAGKDTASTLPKSDLEEAQRDDSRGRSGLQVWRTWV